MSTKKYIHSVSPGTEVDAELISTTVAQPDHTADLHRALATDAHAGKGGSYTYDPATGKRTRNQDPE